MNAINCVSCPLHETRTQIVNGSGNPSADFMFIGEAPGKEEDLSGKPFVGASGDLIDEALFAAGITRDDVFISNIVRCRPPGNRTPEQTEVDICLPYLLYEILEVQPKVLCLLGKSAAQVFVPKMKYITKEEAAGNVYTVFNGIKATLICHPSYYIRGYAPKSNFIKYVSRAYALINT